MNLANVIAIVKNGDWFNGGEHIEIAKGKNQIAINWKGFKRKLKRVLK
jgi:hypothetical protein